MTLAGSMTVEFERRQLGDAKIGIVTITKDEFDQARRIFETDVPVAGSPYFRAASDDLKKPHLVVCQASSRSNMPASQTVSRLLEAWRPEFVFLTGTAGGVQQNTGKDSELLQLGDVVVADYIDYVEYAKLTAGKIIPRKIAYDHPSRHLRANFVNSLSTQSQWRARIGREKPDGGTGDSRVHIGNVAAGEKIFADYTSAHQNKLLKIFDKAIAFEMESYGVASALCEARCSVDYNPQFLTIRGVSDFVNVKDSNADRDAWTEYAASAALAFARELAEALRAYFADRAAYGGLA